MPTLEAMVTNERRHLHTIPEIGFDLPKTQAYIKQRLREMGYTPQTIAQSGVLAKIPGKQDTAIAFRADMDALYVSEAAHHDFMSQHPKQMHACGHDGHMAMLLGLAHYLSKIPTPQKTIVLLFQPAEEGPGGAKVIVDEGVVSTHAIESIYGFHLYPELPEHTIGMKSGPMMAQNGEFDVHVKGVSAHGAHPHDGKDAISAMVNLYSQYQDLITKMIDPLVPSVIAIGTIQGGQMRNIIAAQAGFEGTIRTFEQSTYDAIKTTMHRLATHTARAYDVAIDLEIRDFYPAVYNDETLHANAQSALQSFETQTVRPVMLAEDFAFYQQAIPGLFMLLGTRNESRGHVHPLHSERFNFNESVLTTGVRAYLAILIHQHIIEPGSVKSITQNE